VARGIIVNVADLADMKIAKPIVGSVGLKNNGIL